ncbi:MAG: hypothetical protein H2169_10040 [Opitutus sp.]|nr:hypothetical protein [Opitutus sp.]
MSEPKANFPKGKTVDTIPSTKALCCFKEPEAVITITHKDGALNVKVNFTPSAPSTGELHPAHAGAVAMIRAFTEKQKEGA